MNGSSGGCSGPTGNAQTAFDHGLVGRFNAWFFTFFAGYINHAAHAHKTEAFGGIGTGTIVEIGAGTGANLSYLEPGTHLYAVEPNRRMHPRLKRRCRQAGIGLTILPTGAEHIDLPDGSVDVVMCSLVLCTVGMPSQVVAEARRILRAGGTFRFVEHIAAPDGSVRGRAQRMIRRPWGFVFEGCDPHRDTIATVNGAGFAAVQAHRQRFHHSVFWPVNTAAWGIAVR
ncbi:class I SAM-dependent methyltransferase [Arthrobacter castelli]|uniref:class I SAM-dependent methyltransferase n=1 Tax=Arthrobacter castelli TaxID=271431 RepID=UPI000410ACD2|nr:class I SAM-dependent methyltransferase [Arthrobacter castelli]